MSKIIVLVAFVLLAFTPAANAACAKGGEHVIAVDGTSVCVTEPLDASLPEDTVGACVIMVKQPGHATPTRPASVRRIGVNVTKKACDAATGELRSFYEDK